MLRKAALVSCPPVWRDPIWADFESKHDGTPISRRSCFCQCPVILHTISMEDPCLPLDLALGSRPCPPLWELYIPLVPFITELLQDFILLCLNSSPCLHSFFFPWALSPWLLLRLFTTIGISLGLLRLQMATQGQSLALTANGRVHRSM